MNIPSSKINPFTFPTYVFVLTFFCIATAFTAEPITEEPMPTVFFDDFSADSIPAGWRAEGTNQRGPVATWMVMAATGAPSSPNILALTDTKEARGNTYNLLWTSDHGFVDGVIEIKIKAGSGREDRGGGLIWRVQDKNNYYVARWNPLEDNFRLYFVKNTSRKELDSATVKADPTTWHTIRIHQQGDKITGYFDGEALLSSRDQTFTSSGGIGVWSKADAATMFDDLRVEFFPQE